MYMLPIGGFKGDYMPVRSVIVALTSACGREVLTLKAPITSKVVCFCRLLTPMRLLLCLSLCIDLLNMLAKKCSRRL